MKFSIIVTYYKETKEDEDLLYRCLYSLNDAIKNRNDAEVIVIHDGHLDTLSPRFCFPWMVAYCTPTRENVWGHNSRDLGMKVAKGKYIFHTNYDNFYYPDFLKVFDEKEDGSKVYLYSCRMRGWGCGNTKYRSKKRDHSIWKLFDPPTIKYGNVDCMQVAVARELWEKEGFWMDKTEDSDGKYYVKFAHNNKWKKLNYCIGEHY